MDELLSVMLEHSQSSSSSLLVVICKGPMDFVELQDSSIATGVQLLIICPEKGLGVG